MKVFVSYVIRDNHTSGTGRSVRDIQRKFMDEYDIRRMEEQLENELDLQSVVITNFQYLPEEDIPMPELCKPIKKLTDR